MSEDVDDGHYCDGQSQQDEGEFDESIEDLVECSHRIFYKAINL